ncbi:uncharacterized protein TRAVEDRAFT_69837 [Trametes versicolor FP-101664 SS1]|uniref:uncharacterized protein n=1 Tax=Trametes versicolor (strain FP-101664) TaxID=717944 RepID=UPI0004622FD8|nr:uncharacterized protein TRAVEDRAFT_69837 [Trametes versicolor FP-101664 SS1]EIW61494.1 hypothetical protein TRAVEDRAFT_69837 [Trametes versicolor FP-101664 SS1]
MSLQTKRKYEELDDSDDEEPTLGRQVLPVANLPETFDGVPVDGLQYLFMVRRDARQLPHVTRVANPYDVPEDPSAAPLPGSNGSTPRRDLLPSEEWRETFVRRFKNFRKNSTQPTVRVHIPNPISSILPSMKERDMWWAFLAGRPESEWNPPKKPKQPKVSRWQKRAQGARFADDVQENASLSYDAHQGGSSEAGPSNMSFEMETGPSTPGAGARSLPTPSGTPAPPDLPADSLLLDVEASLEQRAPLKIIAREPTPSLLQHIDHRYAIHLLMYFTHWITLRVEQSSMPLTDITPSHARWMFALLSRVDDWISSDETSLLRNLARACISLMGEIRRRRAAQNGSEAGEVPEEASMIDDASCWMVIGVITGVWGQHDLWMDAEELLSKVETQAEADSNLA